MPGRGACANRISAQQASAEPRRDPDADRVSSSLDAVTTQLPGSIAGGGSSYYQQVNDWCQRYLGRLPTQQELCSWQNHVERGHSISDVQTHTASMYRSRARSNCRRAICCSHA